MEQYPQEPNIRPIIINPEDAKTSAFKALFEAKTGLNLNQVSPAVLSRLVLLNAKTEIIEDEFRGVEAAKIVLEHIRKTDPEKAFKPADERTVLCSTPLTDIGKTGPYIKDMPADKAEKIAACIADIFGVNDHVDTNIVTVAEFVKKFFPEEGEEGIRRRVGILKLAKIDAESMTMRQFIDKHAEWTRDILRIDQGKGLPVDAIIAAQNHHMLEGVNPGGVIQISRAAKLVILIDQYDARLKRGGVTHEGAIQWLEGKINKNTWLDGFLRTDGTNPEREEFLELLEAMNVSLENNTLYNDIKKTENGKYTGPER
jgi:hypothetical protein